MTRKQAAASMQSNVDVRYGRRVGKITKINGDMISIYVSAEDCEITTHISNLKANA